MQDLMQKDVQELNQKGKQQVVKFKGWKNEISQPSNAALVRWIMLGRRIILTESLLKNQEK